MALLLLVLLGACAVTPDASRDKAARGKAAPSASHSASFGGWLVVDLVALPHEFIGLRHGDGPLRIVRTAPLRAAWAAGQRLMKLLPATGQADMLLIDGMAPNAFVVTEGNRARVALSMGMLELLGGDEAAWAALLGHELAHLDLRHRDSRKDRQQTRATASGVAGVLLSIAGVPLGDLLAESASTLVDRSYSREEERAADLRGVDLMREAGYDPAGALRLFERLAAANQSGSLPFLSTHPSGAERVETMRALVADHAKAQAAPPQ